MQSFVSPFSVSHLLTKTISFPLNGSMFDLIQPRAPAKKRCFEIHTYGSNSPPHPGKVKFSTPRMAFQIKFPTPRAKKTFKCPGYARGGGGGMLMFRIDRRIMLTRQNTTHKSQKITPINQDSFYFNVLY